MLYKSPKYPSDPDKVDIIQDFDAPLNDGENYGQKVKGFFVAPVSGDYTFFSSCDDICELYFSMDTKPEHVSKIISQTRPTKHDEFEK